MTAPTIVEQPTEVLQDDPPRQAHYVDKTKIVDAMVNNTGLLTLCGKILYPGRANPEKLPVCPKCREEFDKLDSFMQS